MGVMPLLASATEAAAGTAVAKVARAATMAALKAFLATPWSSLPSRPAGSEGKGLHFEARLYVWQVAD